MWDLILGYNGFGRITGSGESMGGGSFGGAAGLGRMLNAQVGGQVAWLLPLAAVGLGAGLWLTRRAPRTDARRAAWVLFGVWALVHVAVFSTARGVFHPYYVSALAPAVAALAGAGAVTLWRWARASGAGVVALDLALAASAAVAIHVLARTPDDAPWLRSAIPVALALAVFGSVALRRGGLAPRRLLAVTAVAAVFAVAAGPAAYSVATAGRALNGNNVPAGPAAASGLGGGPGGGMGPAPASPAGRPGAAAAGGGTGSLGAATIAWLEAHQGTATYLVAASGSQTTAGIILATGKPVVTIGGFDGADPAPTVAQLASMVASGRLRYVLVTDGGGGPGGSSSQALTAWVKAHGTVVTGAGVTSGTLYRVGA